MHPRFRRTALFEGVLIAAVLAVVIVGVIIVRGGRGSNHAAPSQALNANVVLPALAAATAMPEPSQVATSTVPAATPTVYEPEVIPTTLPLIVPTPEDAIPLPVPASVHVYVEPSEGDPLLSQAAAMQVLADAGIEFATASEWQGQEIHVTAAYGLTTFGSAAEDGTWLGPRNMPLSNGVTLDHLERRAAWVLIYEHAPLTMPVAGVTAKPSHSLYIIDGETGSIMVAMSYATADE